MLEKYSSLALWMRMDRITWKQELICLWSKVLGRWFERIWTESYSAKGEEKLQIWTSIYRQNFLIQEHRQLFIHTLSELVGYNDILSLNTCLRNDFTFNEFTFCDHQNIGISINIKNVFTHYLYQQSPSFWWLQNLNSLTQKLVFINKYFSEFIFTSTTNIT